MVNQHLFSALGVFGRQGSHFDGSIPCGHLLEEGNGFGLLSSTPMMTFSGPGISAPWRAPFRTSLGILHDGAVIGGDVRFALSGVDAGYPLHWEFLGLEFCRSGSSAANHQAGGFHRLDELLKAVDGRRHNRFVHLTWSLSVSMVTALVFWPLRHQNFVHCHPPCRTRWNESGR